MKYRRAEWDIAMPQALESYWTAWNETDLSAIGELLDNAVTDDIVWNDPRDSFEGRNELEAAMRRLRTSKPDYVFTIESEIDAHHGRLRYAWRMSRKGRTLMEGLDIATLDLGLISRIDGFFGSPTPIRDEGSGIPPALR